MENKRNVWSKHTTLRFQIGLMISLSLALVAFEWKTYDPQTIIVLTGDREFPPDEILPPITEPKRPEPPKPKVAPEIIETEEEPDVEIDITFDLDDIDDIPEPEPEPEPLPDEEEDLNEPVVFAEVGAIPQEGMTQFLINVAKNMKYPAGARRMGIEGKVFVQFIIEKDGSLSQLQVVRGIGAGCDEEAIRVLKQSKKWHPARQRGQAVRQRMILPIHFQLN